MRERERAGERERERESERKREREREKEREREGERERGFAGRPGRSHRAPGLNESGWCTVGRECGMVALLLRRSIISAVAGNVSLRCSATTCPARAQRAGSIAASCGHSHRKGRKGDGTWTSTLAWPTGTSPRACTTRTKSRPGAPRRQPARPVRPAQAGEARADGGLAPRAAMVRGMGEMSAPWVAAASRAIPSKSFTAMLALAS